MYTPVSTNEINARMPGLLGQTLFEMTHPGYSLGMEFAHKLEGNLQSDGYYGGVEVASVPLSESEPGNSGVVLTVNGKDYRVHISPIETTDETRTEHIPQMP